MYRERSARAYMHRTSAFLISSSDVSRCVDIGVRLLITVEPLYKGEVGAGAGEGMLLNISSKPHHAPLILNWGRWGM